jgi:urease accessory protein
VDLQEGAVFFGWDVICLGRTASGERFKSGRIRQHLRVFRCGKPLFEELGTLEGGGSLLVSPIGMAGYPVCATFVVMAGCAIGREALDFCRAATPAGDCKWGVSAMGELLVARCLARTSEAPRAYFLKMWEHLRPEYARVPARTPRIWST